MRIAFLCVTLLMVGCAITPKPFTGPSGKQAYSMNCGSDLPGCYQKAGEVCPTGYNILDRASGTVGVPSQGATVMVPTHNLSIECK